MPTTPTTETTPPADAPPDTPVQAESDQPRRWVGERGEGVISAAIAVLIMAFLGVGMWVAFNATFSHTAKNIDHQVNDCIGQTTTNC